MVSADGRGSFSSDLSCNFRGSGLKRGNDSGGAGGSDGGGPRMSRVAQTRAAWDCAEHSSSTLGLGENPSCHREGPSLLLPHSSRHQKILGHKFGVKPCGKGMERAACASCNSGSA